MYLKFKDLDPPKEKLEAFSLVFAPDASKTKRWYTISILFTRKNDVFTIPFKLMTNKKIHNILSKSSTLYHLQAASTLFLTQDSSFIKSHHQ
jgi:hypothetical protein